MRRGSGLCISFPQGMSAIPARLRRLTGATAGPKFYPHDA